MPIRPRAAADLPACVAALRQVHDRDGYPTRWPDDPARWLDPDGLLAAWVAERDGTVVGHVSALAGTHEPGLAAAAGLAPESLVLITRLFTTPAARGLGAARRLLDELLAWAPPRRVGLDVIEESLDAIALYERLGWRLVGRDRAQWRTQRGEHPLIRYYLSPEGAP